MIKILVSIMILTASTMCCGQNFEDGMRRAGMVNIADIDSTILVDLRYSTPDNFLGFDAYGDLESAYMLPEMATRLVTAQKLLRTQGYTLKVLDAARPQSVQYKMWEVVRGTKDTIYVARPTRGGMHNFGAAVDVTLVYIATGKECDMGSPFDWFGREAWIGSKTTTTERNILVNTMKEAGFKVYSKEWWHYESSKYTSNEIRKKYSLLRF